MTATASTTYPTAVTLRCPFTGRYTGTMSLTVDAAGAVTGHGQVSQSGCPFKDPAASIGFAVRGTDDGARG